MGLVLDWQKKLGYTKDPFAATAPSPIRQYIVGLSPLQERLNLFLIKEERFGTISAEKGMGKTMLLQWVNEELAPQKSHAQHYLDAREAGDYDQLVSTLLATRLSFFEKKFGKSLKTSTDEQEKLLLQRLAQEQRNVLLVDNAGALGKQELHLFALIATKTNTHILFADTDERLKRLMLPEGLKDALKLKITEYNRQDLQLLLTARICGAGSAGTFPFDNDDVTLLCKKAEHNPAKLLALARDRAIELSLKVKELPVPSKPVATTSLSATAATPVVQEKSNSFFSIKIAKGPVVATQNSTISNISNSSAKSTTKSATTLSETSRTTISQDDADESIEVPMELSPSLHEDADMLSHIVATAKQHDARQVTATHETGKTDKNILLDKKDVIDKIIADQKLQKKHHATKHVIVKKNKLTKKR